MAVGSGQHGAVHQVEADRGREGRASDRDGLADPALRDVWCRRRHRAEGPVGERARRARDDEVLLRRECVLPRLGAGQVRGGGRAEGSDRCRPGLLSSGYVSPDPTSTNRWIADTALKSVTDKIWLPDLPVHGLSPRSPLGWADARRVPRLQGLLPGHVHERRSRSTARRSSHLAIYYFEDTLTVAGGADASSAAE